MSRDDLWFVLRTNKLPVMQYIVKPPGCVASGFAWHQDSDWCLEEAKGCSQYLSLWCALDDMSQGESLFCCEGSHALFPFQRQSLFSAFWPAWQRPHHSLNGATSNCCELCLQKMGACKSEYVRQMNRFMMSSACQSRLALPSS